MTELLEKYFPFTPDQLEKFRLFAALIRQWNEAVNLISRKDIDHLWERHILHSLAIARVIDFKTARVVDIGTGGGFPGVPLAIMFPQAQFTLVDSIAKKITALEDIIKKLELDNAVALRARSEQVKDKFDFVVARAVADFRKFYKQTRHLLRPGQVAKLPNGIFYLKGGDFTQEISPFAGRVKVFNISDFFEEEFFETKKIIYLRY